MLGIARGDSPAAEALRACGATYDALVSSYETLRAGWEEEHPHRERDGVRLNPAAYAFLGRSEGFAAAGGSTRLRPEHALLSLLWDADSVQSGMLRKLGTTRAAVQGSLGRLGIAVPAIPPPPDDDRPRGERVSFPSGHLGFVLRELPSRLPEGSPFAFNFTSDGRAWVSAGPDVDLEGMVADVLRDATSAK